MAKEKNSLRERMFNSIDTRLIWWMFFHLMSDSGIPEKMAISSRLTGSLKSFLTKEMEVNEIMEKALSLKKEIRKEVDNPDNPIEFNIDNSEEFEKTKDYLFREIDSIAEERLLEKYYSFQEEGIENTKK